MGGVPSVSESALAGEFALVRGYSAWIIWRLLRDFPGGLEEKLARTGVELGRREDVLQAHAVLGCAGALWQQKRATSTSGRPEGVSVEPALRSAGDPAHHLGARDAAALLGVSARHVRALAGASVLRGRQDHGGRWMFDPADVEAERERRMTERKIHVA